MNDLEVSLIGAKVVIHLNEHIRRMEEEMEYLRTELQAYQNRILPTTVGKEEREASR